MICHILRAPWTMPRWPCVRSQPRRVFSVPHRGTAFFQVLLCKQSFQSAPPRPRCVCARPGSHAALTKRHKPRGLKQQTHLKVTAQASRAEVRRPGADPSLPFPASGDFTPPAPRPPPSSPRRATHASQTFFRSHSSLCFRPHSTVDDPVVMQGPRIIRDLLTVFRSAD